MGIPHTGPGTKLRHIQGQDLSALEQELEAIPFKVDVIAVNRVGMVWYIHFYVPTKEFDKARTKKEISEPTKNIRGKI